MSFQVLSPQPTPTSQIINQLAQGYGAGIQEKRELFQQEQKHQKAAPGIASMLNEAGVKVDVDSILSMLQGGMGEQDILKSGLEISKQKSAEEKEARTQKEAEQKLLRENAKSKASYLNTKKNIDWLRDNIDYTGWAGIPGTKAQFGRFKRTKAGRIREEFDKKSLWMTDKIFTHFNKGVINKPKWETIKDELAPNSKLSKNENIARTNALESMLELPPDISPEEFDNYVDNIRQNLDIKTKGQGRETEKGKRPSLEEIFG